MRANYDDHLKITFLSSNPRFEEYFTAVVRSCLGDIAILNRLTFVTLKPGQRMRDALKPHADGSESSYFDYVEYFNGMSLDIAHNQHLSDLKEVCIDCGDRAQSICLFVMVQSRSLENTVLSV
jgi:hypothetical protein